MRRATAASFESLQLQFHFQWQLQFQPQLQLQLHKQQQRRVAAAPAKTLWLWRFMQMKPMKKMPLLHASAMNPLRLFLRVCVHVFDVCVMCVLRVCLLLFCY